MMLHKPIVMPAHAKPGATRRFVLAVLGLWAIAAAALLGWRAHAIAAHDFPDVDDQLRLVEVRDWLNGQSFWDVSQHRMNQPFGAPMHWSRIVDAPIAAAEIVLRPLFGADGAQWAAAAIVPMMTLGVVMLLVALIGRRLSGPATGLLAAAFAPTTIAMMIQLQPMRVDHHGWEIASALAALAASLSERRRWAGVLAGVAIAIGLQISLELLPFAAALGIVIGGRWLLDPSTTAGRRLAGYAAGLFAAEAVLFLALHRPAEWGAVYCDAVSPPHMAALAIVGIGGPACVAFAPRSIVGRAALLAIVAGVAAAAFRAIPPHCGLDPFSMLGPLEKRFWLANVLEGRPVWFAGAMLAIAVTGFPLVGLACCAVAVRDATGRARERWLAYGAVLASATIVGVFVLRASALSNGIALVPVAHVAVRLIRRTRGHGSLLVRVLGTAAVITALSPWAPGLVAGMLPIKQPRSVGNHDGPTACTTPAVYRALDTLAPARLFAPLDAGPPLLLMTHHAVLASGHHRNHIAMADEIRAMTGDDATAERMIRRHGMAYVLMCPDLNELSVYRKVAPHGFVSHLLTGAAPGWLERVRLPRSGVMLWRVRDQPPAGSPSSRSAGGSVPAVRQISRSAVFSPSS